MSVPSDEFLFRGGTTGGFGIGRGGGGVGGLQLRGTAYPLYRCDVCAIVLERFSLEACCGAGLQAGGTRGLTTS